MNMSDRIRGYDIGNYDIINKDSQIVRIMFGLIDRNGKEVFYLDAIMDRASMLSPHAQLSLTETPTEPSGNIEYDFEGPVDKELVVNTANSIGRVLNQDWVKIVWPWGKTSHLKLRW